MTGLARFLGIAVLTGGFCVALGLAFAALLPPFVGYQVAAVTFLSGFTGSVFAQLVLGRGSR